MTSSAIISLSEPMIQHQRDAFMQAMLTLLPEASAIAKRFFRQPYQREQKADTTLVTKADTAIEHFIRQWLAAHFPDDGLLGEEYADHQADAPWQWVIDPIDGTRNFISGTPLFTTLIGRAYAGELQWGAIAQPITQELWLGGRELTTRHYANMCQPDQSQMIAPRACESISQAVICTTAPECLTADGFALFQYLSRQAAVTSYGKDAFAYAMLAHGCVDIVMEEGLNCYDFAALIPILQAAGAVVTDWRGQPITLHSQGDVLACATPALHQQLLTMIANYPWLTQV